MDNLSVNINNIKDPEFWRQISKNRDKQCPGEANNFSCAPKREFWDNMAKCYDDLENCGSYLDMVNDIIEHLKKSGAVGKDKTILDVGCGTGNYSIRFSSVCKEVTGLDISDKMLEECREKIKKKSIENVKVINNDWWCFDIKQNNFENNFDLVFASMTPLTRDPFMIDKMLQCSRGFMGIVGWAGGKSNQLIEEISLELWGKSRIKPPDMVIMFNYLYSLGYAPELKFFWGKWEKTKDTNDQIEYIIKFLENTKKLDDNEKKFINEKVKKLDLNGKITSHTDVRIAFMLIDTLKKIER
jgi:SAM-dependent methyltransferase